MLQENSRLVKSHDINIDADYANWIAEVKHRYRSSQVKAAVRVNAEKLLFNWQLGRDLVQKKAEEQYYKILVLESIAKNLDERQLLLFREYIRRADENYETAVSMGDMLLYEQMASQNLNDKEK